MLVVLTAKAVVAKMEEKIKIIAVSLPLASNVLTMATSLPMVASVVLTKAKLSADLA